MLSADIGNLALASGLPQIDGDLLAFAVDESEQGPTGTDLNGDGDIGDAVIHLFNRSTGLTTNLGFDATGGIQLEGHLLAFSVWEFRQGGSDLNGDGDTGDFVLHVFDINTGMTTNIGLGMVAGFTRFQINGDRIAFSVSEISEGNTDLNNDGDSDDPNVAHLYDAVTGQVRNLGLSMSSGSGFTDDGDTFFFRVPESLQNMDLNGDGDAFDQVLHLYDTSSDTVTNTGLALGLGSVQHDENRLAFLVSEQGQTDLNGDGDAFDNVLHLYDIASSTATNLMLEGDGALRLDGDLLAFRVFEFSQGGSDLNGDGDAVDRVLHVHDLGLGTTTNLGLEADSNIQLQDELVAFQSRRTLHVYDHNLQTITNVGLTADFNSGRMQLDGRRIAIQVDEVFQGSDLNGDGDFGDDVVVLYDYDPAGSTMINTGLDGTTPGFALRGDRVFIRVRESNQGDTDLNRDGDTTDVILHVFDAVTETATNLHMDGSNLLFVSDTVLATLVFENGTGGMDFNGDGDLGDTMLRVVDLGFPLTNVPEIQSVDVGSDLRSINIQFNDTQLRADQAINPNNYRLRIANGDANGDGDFFNDGDETLADIFSISYYPASDRITLQLLDAVFADIYRLDIDGDDAGTDETFGLVNENRLSLLGGDFQLDFDLRVLTLVEALLDKVESLGLVTSAEQSLTGRLTAATKVLGAEIDSDDGLTHILESFRLGVEGWFDRGEITVADRDDLFADVDLILLGLALA